MRDLKTIAQAGTPPQPPASQPAAEPERDTSSPRFLFSDALENKLFEYEALLKTMGCTDQLTFCDALKRAMQARTADLCVISAQPSPEAALLINGLLGKESLMPQGVLPVTLPIVRIEQGEADLAALTDELGKTAEAAVDDAFWQRCEQVFLRKSNPRAALSASVIRVRTPSTFLRDNGCAIVQCAGLGGQVEQAVLLGSACAIFVTSALQVMLASEMERLARLPEYGFDSVIVAVGGMSSLNRNEDRALVMRSVRDKLSKLPLKATLFIDCPDADLKADDTLQGCSALRRHLTERASGEAAAAQREAQIKRALVVSMRRAAAFAQDKLKEAQAGTQEKETAATARKRAVESDRDKYLALRTAMTERYSQAQRWMQDTIALFSQNTIDDLRFSLDNAGDAERWWNKSYPYLLHSKLQNLANTMEANLRARHAKDIEWLAKIVEMTFKETLERPDDITVADRELIAALRRAEIIDTESMTDQRKRERILSTVVTAGGMIASVVMRVPAVGVLAGGAYAVFAMNKNTKMTQAVKARMERALQTEVTHVMSDVERMTGENLYKLYSSPVDALAELERTWVTKQHEAIDKALSEAAANAPTALWEEALGALSAMTIELKQL